MSSLRASLVYCCHYWGQPHHGEHVASGSSHNYHYCSEDGHDLPTMPPVESGGGGGGGTMRQQLLNWRNGHFHGIFVQRMRDQPEAVKNLAENGLNPAARMLREEAMLGEGAFGTVVLVRGEDGRLFAKKQTTKKEVSHRTITLDTHVKSYRLEIDKVLTGPMHYGQGRGGGGRKERFILM